jgi:hypothetical protein
MSRRVDWRTANFQVRSPEWAAARRILSVGDWNPARTGGELFTGDLALERISYKPNWENAMGSARNRAKPKAKSLVPVRLIQPACGFEAEVGADVVLRETSARHQMSTF